MLLYFYIYFFCIFLLFFIIKFVFLSFLFLFFMIKVSNFRNRILTNQKRELVVSNCQRNCMIVISDTLIGSWMCFSFCLLEYCQSFMRNQEEKFELQKKVRRRVCVSQITFLAAHPPFYVIFCRFFRLLPSFRLLQFSVEKNVFLFQKMVLHTPLLMSSFCHFFSLLPSFRLLRFYVEENIFLFQKMVVVVVGGGEGIYATEGE